MNDSTHSSTRLDFPSEAVARDRDRIEAELHRVAAGTDPFAAAVRATRMPMVISDPRAPDNPVIFVNDAFCRLTGYAREEIVGRNCRFLQGPETDPVAVARLRGAIEATRSIEIDIRNHRKNGEPFWNRLLLAPVHDAAGELAYFFASQVDVTLERERLAGLENHNAALMAESADRLRAHQESEARLRFATEAGRLGVWEVDLQTGVLTASPECKASFGRDPGQPFTRADLAAATHPDDATRVAVAFARSIAESAEFDIEHRIQRPDGSVGWIGVRAQVVRAADGSPLRMAGISLDVTERRAAEMRLEVSEQSLRLATEAAGIGTWDLDLTGDVLTWSDRTKAMFGISPHVACTMADFYAGLHPDDLVETSRAFAAAIDPAQRVTYDVEYRTIGREDGRVRWVAAKGRGLFEGGRCRRALGTAIDITARKTAETRQAFLLALGDRLRDLADEPDAMLAAACELLARHLRVARAGCAEYAEPFAAPRLACQWALQTSQIRTAALDDYTQAMLSQLRSGGVIRLEDERRQVGGPRAVLALPVRRAGRSVAFFFTEHAAPRRWTDDEAALVQEAADRIWIAVERGRARMALRELNATLEARVAERTADRDRMWRLSNDVMLVARFDGSIMAVNPAWTRLLGWRTDDLIGSSFLGLVHPDDLARTMAEAGSLAGGHVTSNFENRYRHLDGSYRWLSWAAVPDAEFIHAVGRDVTAEKAAAEALSQAEEQLRQAQKMEAVGQLTGGIAHDFNNLLTGILGALELLQRRVAEGRTNQLERYTSVAITSANRAAALTQRLLAFSRRQPLDPKVVDANRLVAGMEDLLQRTLGPATDLQLMLSGALWPTLCDMNQLESAILNLAINARDAMPDGGRLTIETSNVALDDVYAAAEADQLKAGDYVCIAVTDTGTGMEPDVISRAFEPFFTTKPQGRGTGLGLSMLYGFIRQSGGHVRIDSEPGRGTCFRLYLPRHRGPRHVEDGGAAARDASGPSGSGGTVLVVDDEAAVRLVITDVLQEMGYHALEAADGPAGLRVLETEAGVDLLITDVGLPGGLNGLQTADAARVMRPGLQVLLVTGFAGNAGIGATRLPEGMQILTKPFAADALAIKVRAMLEA